MIVRTLILVVLTILAVAPASALIVEVDGALMCPELSNFRAIAGGAAVPEACVRAHADTDLYGPVGRAPDEPGGPFVRVRMDETFYWAEESAFYSLSGPGADRAPVPPVLN